MILIFSRRFNDIDHTAPIAFKLAEGGEDVAMLSVKSELNLRGDFRLNYLRDFSGVPSFCALERFHVSPIARFSSLIVRALGSLESFAPFLRPIKQRIIKKIDKYCDLAWAQSLISTLLPKAIIMDWGDPDKSAMRWVIVAAKERKIPIVAVPHGVNYMTNALYSSWAVESGKPHKYDVFLADCDHVVTQHRHHAGWLIRGGVPASKVVVLGSTRFCPEWQRHMDDLVSSQPFNRDSGGRLRVVYMDHAAGESMRLNVDEIARSIYRLAELDYIDIVVKPSMANNVCSSESISRLTRGSEKFNSASLIDWADVVMGSTSSILLDVLIKGKTLLYPKFYHQNEQLFDEMGACLRVDNQEELESELYRIHTDKNYVPYDQENVDSFLTEIVCGAVPNRDVLGDYRDFILSVAEGANGNPRSHDSAVVAS